MKQDHIPEPSVKFEPWAIALIMVILIMLAYYFDRRQAQNERDIAGIYDKLNIETNEREARR